MAILKGKKNKENNEKKKSVVVEDKEKFSSGSGARDLAWILKKPRITEKAVFSAENKVYVFEIDQRATKKDVAAAVSHYYKVTPIKVNVAKNPSKKVTRRKRSGTTSGYKTGKKKAYVYLDKKDSIEIV